MRPSTRSSLLVVPAHVGHEQADVDESVGHCLVDVEIPGVGVAHLVELQHRDRRRLLSLAGMVVVVAVCERCTGGKGCEQPQND
jgi:hypothetical protein